VRCREHSADEVTLGDPVDLPAHGQPHSVADTECDALSNGGHVDTDRRDHPVRDDHAKPVTDADSVGHTHPDADVHTAPGADPLVDSDTHAHPDVHTHTDGQRCASSDR
jgi:hypothetical protein